MLSSALQDKLQSLREEIARCGEACVCFSGGVDSTLLLAVAHQVLGPRVFAITEVNPLYPVRESDEAVDFCTQRGIIQVLVTHDPEDVEGLCDNPKNRCYLCKSNLFTQFKIIANKKARELGLIEEGGRIALMDGSNVTDLSDYRPGAQAVKEHGVLSPLQAVGLTKREIRDISKELGLPTWDKPSFACLASRFVYGQRITNELLQRVDAAEQLFLDAGFKQIRVRMHENGSLARIEVEPQCIDEALTFLRSQGAASLHELGFAHVSLDVDGYRTGSMN